MHTAIQCWLDIQEDVDTFNKKHVGDSAQAADGDDHTAELGQGIDSGDAGHPNTHNASHHGAVAGMGVDDFGQPAEGLLDDFFVVLCVALEARSTADPGAKSSRLFN